nr:Gag-Pol polyprotein [Tanacetum cinerariifolium]
MAENVIAAGSENRPLMLEKGMYDSWKTRIMLYIRGKENGEMLRDSVEPDPYKFKSEITVKDSYGVTDTRRKKRFEDLKGDDKLRVILDEEQQYFLDDSLEETDDYEDLQLQAIINMKTDHVDAYDSDCGDEATTNTIFMENLSPVGSLNDDMIVPCYDSDTLFEVPHYDTYQDSDVLNSNIQDLGYNENIISANESCDELKGNNDVISYTDYMLTIGNHEANYVPPPVQNNDMMLIEQMKS